MSENKPVGIHFLIPSRNKIKKGDSLNILIGVHNENTVPVEYTFRIFADAGDGYKEIFSNTKLLEPAANPHHYFNLPPECFSEERWGFSPEEVFIATSENGEHAEIIFIE